MTCVWNVLPGYLIASRTNMLKIIMGFNAVYVRKSLSWIKAVFMNWRR